MPADALGELDETMPIRIAIVGPGRLGQALARRLVFENPAGSDVDVEFLGFHARDPERAQAAVDKLGVGATLDADSLATAAVVILAVSDDALESVASSLAAASCVRPCSLWLHCSGSRPREALSSIEEQSARTAVLHPLAPVPDAERGADNLAGAPGLLVCEDRSEHLARRIASKIGLRVERVAEHDASAYHAACALAANGSTALIAESIRLMTGAVGVSEERAKEWVLALVSGALRSIQDVGAEAALTGPVERSDPATIEAHLNALETVDPDAVPLYVASMRAALRLARRRRGPRPGDEALLGLLDERTR